MDENDLSSWRGWWLALRADLILKYALLVSLLGVIGAVLSLISGLTSKADDLLFVPVLVGMPVYVILAIGQRNGLPVARSNQPELYELVCAVARRLGTPMPRRVWLTKDVEVAAGLGLRRDLLIGLPLADCMSAGQLSALIGHELTLLAQPRSWMTRRVHQEWSNRASLYETSAKDEAWLARTSGFASPLDESADRAAAVAAGSLTVAAEAFALADIAFDEHIWYMTRVNELSTKRKGRIRIRDVEDGWRHLLATGRGFFPPGFWSPERVGLAHPGLAYAFTQAPPPRLGQPLDRVRLAPLSAADQRRMFGKRRKSGFRREPWLTFADISPEWVNDVARQDFERARVGVEQLLGRTAQDDAEVISVLANRGDELAAQVLGPADEDDGDEPEDDEVESSWILMEAAQFLLLRAGWRMVHPAVDGVLVSPEGRCVDLRPMPPGQIAELLTEEHALA